MKLKTTIIFLSLTLCCIQLKAQVGINTDVPDASAYLDINGTAKGFLPPRMTNTERDAIVKPATGLIIFSTTDVTLQQNTGTPDLPSWSSVGGTQTSETISTDWFYSPITLIEVTGNQEYTKDLYSDYAEQFKNAQLEGKTVALEPYSVNDLEFYVLGYDKEGFPTVKISNTGILTYTPDPNKITENSYLNVIFKIKKK